MCQIEMTKLINEEKVVIEEQNQLIEEQNQLIEEQVIIEE